MPRPRMSITMRKRKVKREDQFGAAMITAQKMMVMEFLKRYLLNHMRGAGFEEAYDSIRDEPDLENISDNDLEKELGEQLHKLLR